MYLLYIPQRNGNVASFCLSLRLCNIQWHTRCTVLQMMPAVKIILTNAQLYELWFHEPKNLECVRKCSM